MRKFDQTKKRFIFFDIGFGELFCLNSALVLLLLV